MAVKKAILPFTTVKRDVDKIMISEIGPSEKEKYHRLHLYVESNEQNELTSKIVIDSWIQGRLTAFRGEGDCGAG